MFDLPLQLTLLPPEAKSQIGMDYSRLLDLLINQQWEEADVETKEIMLKISGREEQGFLDRQSAQQIPNEELYSIDQLWAINSGNRFGFSVQNRILQSFFQRETSQSSQVNKSINISINPLSNSGNLDGLHLRDRFASSVGWRVGGKWLRSDELIFDLSAPVGHLPSPRIAAPSNLRRGGEQACQETVGRWCGACCFGSVWCGVLFPGWWYIVERFKINENEIEGLSPIV